MVQQTGLILGREVQHDALAALVFFATLMVYNALRIFSLPIDYNKYPSEMHRWMEGNRYLVYGIMGLSGIVAFTGYVFLSYRSQLALAGMAAISVFYVVPLFRFISGSTFRLRDIGWLKPFIVGFVWAVTTVLLPLFEWTQGDYSWQYGSLLFFERLFFVAAVTIPFDIRDLSYDDQELRFKTIPMKLGVKGGNYLALGVLFLFLLLAMARLYFYDAEVDHFLLLAYIASYFFSAIFINNTLPKRREYYYTLWLDLTLIVQFLLVAIALSL